MSNIPIYNDCKNGLKEPDYIHQTLKEILTPTYGIIIYHLIGATFEIYIIKNKTGIPIKAVVIK